MKFENLKDVQSLAIVGATGLVGKEFLSLLEEDNLRIPKIRLLASKKSVGETIEYEDIVYDVEALTADSFKDCEIAFFSTPNEVTQQYVPLALESGCLVVDDSSCYRMKPEVPLVIPEINGTVLKNFKGQLIATPNCTVTPVALALKPLLNRYGIKRVVASTYQAVSGAGTKGFEELAEQTAKLLNGQPIEELKAFPHQIAFNCLPMVGSLLESGESDEEAKFKNELSKILELPDLKVSVSCVRVPTFCSHAATVNVELEEGFDNIETIRELLEASPGVRVIDNPAQHLYPTAIETTGTDFTFIGRIRKDTSVKSGISFWVITDNLRKGAALNSLQILDTVYRYRRMS